MALHTRQQFKGRIRLLIREAIKDIQAIIAHDRKNPNNVVLTPSILVVANTLVSNLQAALTQTIQR